MVNFREELVNSIFSFGKTIGAGLGFGSLIFSLSRNPAEEQRLFKYALTEAVVGLLALMMSFLLINYFTDNLLSNEIVAFIIPMTKNKNHISKAILITIHKRNYPGISNIFSKNVLLNQNITNQINKHLRFDVLYKAKILHATYIYKHNLLFQLKNIHLNNIILKKYNNKISEIMIKKPVLINSFETLLLDVPKKETLVIDNYFEILNRTKQVSGLVTLSSEILQNKLESIEYIRVSSILLAKTLYFFFSEEHFGDSPINKTANVLTLYSLFITMNGVNKDIFEKIIFKRLGPLSQHTIVFIGSFTNTIPLASLSKSYPQIDFSSYPKFIGYLPIIETQILANAIFLNQYSHENINISAIYHENFDIQNEDKTLLFKSDSSLKQTGQPFADILIYKFNVTPNFNISVDTYYKDIKTYYRGIALGHITIIPGVTTNQKKMDLHLNSITSHLTAKQKELEFLLISIEDIIFLETMRNFIDQIKKIKKNNHLTISEKIQKVNILLLQTYCSDFGQKMVSYDINLTIAGDFNKPISNNQYDSYAKDVEEIIGKNLEKMTSKDFSDFFQDFIPQTNYMNSKKTLAFVDKFIKTVIPENYQKEILNNLIKSIEL